MMRWCSSASSSFWIPGVEIVMSWPATGRDGQAQASIDLMRQFAALGKPVILGETFMLT
jgi:hypothetical protein